MTDPYPGPVGNPAPAAVRPIPGGLGIATLILGGLFTACVVLSFATSFEAADVYAGAARQGIDAWDTRVVAYDVVQIGAVVLIPLYIVACLFLYYARGVADAMGAPQARGKVWVWLGWWVPIVSFWFPYQVVRDLLRAAHRGGEPSTPLGLWWAGWLTLIVGNRVAANAIPTDGVPDASMASALPFIEGVIAVATVIAFVLWIRIVRAIQVGLSSR